MDSIELWDPRGHVWRLMVPRTHRERMRGLLGREELEVGTGMLFLTCRRVHTIRMRFSVDVVFLDRAMTVIDVHVVAPGRWSIGNSRARHVLEVPAGSGFHPGEVLGMA